MQCEIALSLKSCLTPDEELSHNALVLNLIELTSFFFEPIHARRRPQRRFRR